VFPPAEIAPLESEIASQITKSSPQRIKNCLLGSNFAHVEDHWFRYTGMWITFMLYPRGGQLFLLGGHSVYTAFVLGPCLLVGVEASLDL